MRLVFIGGGRLAMELYGWMKLANALVGYEEICYVSTAKTDFPFNYLGDIDVANVKNSDKFILAIGNVEYRKSAIKKFEGLKESFITFIHPTSLISEDLKIGKGAVIFPFCLISVNCQIQDFAFLNGYSSIGHDSIIGENLVMSPYSAITGNCTLGNNVYMATHSSIIPGKKIGNDVKMSAGSVAMKHIEDNYILMGPIHKTIKL